MCGIYFLRFVLPTLLVSAVYKLCVGHLAQQLEGNMNAYFFIFKKRNILPLHLPDTLFFGGS